MFHIGDTEEDRDEKNGRERYCCSKDKLQREEEQLNEQEKQFHASGNTAAAATASVIAKLSVGL